MLALLLPAVVAPLAWRTARLMGALRRVEEQRAALLERAIRVGELERTRVAVELHDGPIQRLSTLAYAIEATAVTAPDGARDCLEDVRERLSVEVEGLRRVMAELRPPALDDGLVPALGDYLGEFAKAHGVATTVTDRLDGVRLGDHAEVAVYRVVQEALANVAKHARASRVDVVVDADEESAQVTVRDDGVGFDPASLARTRDHFGLDAIRERMTNVGGTVELRTRPGAGTAVVLRVPLPLAHVA